MEDTSTGGSFNPKEVDETHSLWNVLVRNSYDSILNSLLETYKVDCYLGHRKATWLGTQEVHHCGVQKKVYLLAAKLARSK